MVHLVDSYSPVGESIVSHLARAGSHAGRRDLMIRNGLPSNDNPHHQWWKTVLRGDRTSYSATKKVTIVDAFSSVGGLSLGASMALEAVGLVGDHLLAIDLDAAALEVYRSNFCPNHTLQEDISQSIDYHIYGQGKMAKFAYAPELTTVQLGEQVGKVDLYMAGPPCQGHSNLNNHTRRSDPRNQLYLAGVSVGIALESRMIIMENVADVLSDKTDVVGTATSLLTNSGYHVSSEVLNAAEFGAAQSRRRHILIATVEPHLDLDPKNSPLRKQAMSLEDVISDLGETNSGDPLHESSVLSATNVTRIRYLFENNEFDLPNHQRPDCHKNGHTYPSVYGRLYGDKPSPTITSGYSSPGRGRYIHPTKQRVITSREAARIQGFPDWFTFGQNGEPLSRKNLAKWIGDAVPSQLAYAAVLTALTGFAKS